MKQIRIITLVLGFLTCASPTEKQTFLWEILQNPFGYKMYFSFPGRYESQEKKEIVLRALLKLIDESQISLELYVYSFREPSLLDALQKAKARGVRIKIISDSEIDYRELEKSGFDFRRWNSSGLHHLKVLVADQKKIFLGTGNFTEWGLQRDYNAYLEFSLEEDFRNSWNDLLAEMGEEPYYQSKDILFLDSPKRGKHIQSLILKEVRNAKSKIQYLIFDHFDPIFTKEIYLAQKRGVVVEAVYDRPLDPEGELLARSRVSLFTEFRNDGNEDRIDDGRFGRGGLLHHKTLIIDEKILLFGSYNISQSARDKNREILLRTESPYLLGEIQKEFQRVWSSAYPQEKEVLRTIPSPVSIANPLHTTTNSGFEWIDPSFSAGYMEWGNGLLQSTAYLAEQKAQWKWSEVHPASSGIFSLGVRAGQGLFPLVPFHHFLARDFQSEIVLENQLMGSSWALANEVFSLISRNQYQEVIAKQWFSRLSAGLGIKLPQNSTAVEILKKIQKGRFVIHSRTGNWEVGEWNYSGERDLLVLDLPRLEGRDEDGIVWLDTQPPVLICGGVPASGRTPVQVYLQREWRIQNRSKSGYCH